MKNTIFTLISSVLFSISLFAQPGTLDESFGLDGVSVVACGVGGVARDIVILQDNTAIMVGSCFSGPDYKDSFLAKLKDDGTLDTSFGDGGTVLDPRSVTDDQYQTVAIQDDGFIVAVGNAEIDGKKQLVMARYFPEGDPDINFGTNGYVILGDDQTINPRDVKIQADGKILILYTHSFDNINPYGNGVNVARFNTDGILDTSFGNLSGGGIYSISDFEEKTMEAGAMDLLPNGKIVFTYNLKDIDDGNLIAVHQLTEDGTADESFGNDGFTFIGEGENNTGYCHDIKVHDNGKITVGGSVAKEDGDYDQGLWGLNSDGAVNTSFGENGMVMHHIFDDDGISLAIQPDNKILLGGLSYIFTPQRAFRSDFLLVRYNEDGSVDETFGEDGVAMTSIGGEDDYDYSYATALQSDGKIIQVGQAFVDDAYRTVSIRYHNDIETTVVENDSKEFSVQLFPNPASDILYVQTDNEHITDEVIILDAYGKKVYEGKFEQSYNISAYAPGVYVLQFLYAKKIITSRKFLKQ